MLTGNQKYSKEKNRPAYVYVAKDLPNKQSTRSFKSYFSLKKEQVKEEVKAATPPYQPEIPCASIEETGVKSLEDRDWRLYFASKLFGKGLEIGPLHRPLVRHDGMDMDYVDRYSLVELLEHYPELAGFPLVDPNIIGDAESLVNVEDEKYDFLVSAHVIEHMRDPLSAIKQWCRVVKPGGLIYLIVPDKRYTFDKHRVRTTLEHMILDYVAPSRERDLEHYLDQAVHVNEKVGSEAVEFAREWEKIDYSIHFHVFLPSDMVNLLKWFSANISPIEIVEGPVKRPHYPRLRQATSEEMIESVGSQSHTKDTEDPEAEIKYNLGSDEFHLLIRRV